MCGTGGKYSHRIGTQCKKSLEAVGPWVKITLTEERGHRGAVGSRQSRPTQGVW